MELQSFSSKGSILSHDYGYKQKNSDDSLENFLLTVVTDKL